MRERWLALAAGMFLLPACGLPVVEAGRPDGGPADAAATDAGEEVSPLCGNGLVEAGEACDPGLFTPAPIAALCHDDCQLARCGDGVVDLGEDCDAGGPSAACTRDCRLAEVITTYRITAGLHAQQQDGSADPPPLWGELEGCLELALREESTVLPGGVGADFEVLAFGASLTDTQGGVHALAGQDDGQVEVITESGWEPTLGYLRIYLAGFPELHLLDFAVDGVPAIGDQLGGPGHAGSWWSGTFPWPESVEVSGLAFLTSLGFLGEVDFELQRAVCDPS